MTRSLKPRRLHSWKLSPKDAMQVQRDLRGRYEESWDDRAIEVIVAADVAFPKPDRVRAGVVALRYPECELLETVVREGKCTFPYIPGLLSFREIPMILRALSRLETRPDLLICDAHGRAHPRRVGLATHLGILLDVPTIGSAKSWLFGDYEEPALRRGSRTPLRDPEGIVLGNALRTRDGTKPIFVSPGHRITPEKAVEVILSVSPKYRIPVPIRMADRLAGGGALRTGGSVRCPRQPETRR